MGFLSTFVLAVSLSAGAMPSYGFVVRDGTENNFVSEPRYSTDISLELQGLDNLFFIGYGVHTESAKSNYSWGFAPRTNIYVVDAGLRLNGFELGWAHQCQHPVESTDLSITKSDPRFGGYDAIYLSYKASFKMFQ